MTTARALVELVRLPAALTVPGDTIAGAAAAGWPAGRRTAVLPVASACLYWAGMALNDYADRDLDAVERPERPIPSGRVSPGTALGLAAGLTAAGVGLAATVSRRHLAVSASLAATVWAYDLLAKPTVLGPVVMGANRGLDVALGAAGNLPLAVPSALALTAHTIGVTALSRGEVHGTTSTAAASSLAVTGAVAAWAAGRGNRPVVRAASAALSGAYAVFVGAAQRQAVLSPDAGTVRRATGSGIKGMIPLQGALAAGSGALPAAAALLALRPMVQFATRRISAT